MKCVLLSLVLYFLTAATGHGDELRYMQNCVKGEPNWTGAEHRVWASICGTGAFDSKTIESLNADFLRDLITVKPYQDTIAMTGVAINNVKIIGAVDLRKRVIGGGLYLGDVSFENGSVLLDDATLNGGLEISATTAARLSLDNARVARNVYIRGPLKISANAARIGGEVYLATGITEIDIMDANIGGDLELNRLEKVSIRGHNTTIGGSLKMQSMINGISDPSLLERESSLIFPRAKISHDVSITDTHVSDLTLTDAEIGGSLRLTSVLLKTISARGLHVSKELILAPSGGDDLKWRPGSTFDIRNAHISRISSPRKLSYWPERLLLADAQFENFSSEEEYVTPFFKFSQEPEIRWFKDWLAQATKDKFEPQPYQYVISMADKKGDSELRDSIGFEKKDRERELACLRPISLDCIILNFSRTVVGYGYQYYRTVWFVVFFVGLGAIIFQFAPAADKQGMKYGLAYSFDMFLPLIHLRDLHSGVDIKNWVRYYFYVHKLAGWAAGSFLVAALSGLTK